MDKQKLVEHFYAMLEYEIQINNLWREDDMGFSHFTEEGAQTIKSVLSRMIDMSKESPNFKKEISEALDSIKVECKFIKTVVNKI